MEISTRELKEELTRRQEELKEQFTSELMTILKDVEDAILDKKSKLTPNKLDRIAHQLWEISTSLNGLGALFNYQSKDSLIEPEEYVGIALLLYLLIILGQSFHLETSFQGKVS